MDNDLGPPAGRREWLGLAVLALPTMLTMIDIGVLFLALPALTADLGATATQQLWITDGYGFLIAAFLVTMGTLGDRFGRRRVLLVGAAAFGVLSITAAYAPSPELLIATRALMGIAGATIMPSTLALIMGMFRHPRQRGLAIAVWATALTAGVAMGPILGGVLLQWFWWGSAFLVGVPIMLLLLVTGPALLPDMRHPGPGRLDPVSVVLSLAALLPFVYGFKEVARSGWRPLPVLIALAGLAIGVWFVLRQRRLDNPLLDLRLFRIRAVSGALVLSLLVAAVQGGSGFYVAQYLQLVEELTPLQTGLWLLVPTLALIVGIFVSQGLAQRIRPAQILAAGVLVAAAGMLVLTRVSPASGLLPLLFGFTIVYIGVSPIGPLVGQLVVPAAPPGKAGSAASLQSTSGELGTALGIAILGSVGVAVYRGAVALPAGTPAGSAAGETMAGAVATAQNLPPELASALLDSARSAFAAGLNTAAAICAITFTVLAMVALATLRRVPPTGAAAPGPATAPAAPRERKLSRRGA
ncbi:MFS transporter [Allorhizocola rhizosphaerae]|uniref:MFS transporter n=1 Tax=Allorhizocola rhizosphaerae TaxID=1872709 RepID=UPI000E3E60FA